MNDITKMLIQSTTKIMKDVCTKELVNEAENGQWAASLWEILAESGMLTVACPEELEGTGGSYADAYQILRLAGKYSAPIPLAETYMGNWLLADLGLGASNEPLAILVNKNKPFQLRRDQEGWIVSGKAQSVPWARDAKQLLVLGETESGAVLAIVNAVGAELSHGRNIAGEPRDTVILDAIRVENRRVFSVDARQVQERLLHTGALCRSVMMAGALERILELAVTYSKERTQFGQPIHRFQAVQHHLASLAGEIAAAETAAQYAVDASEKGSATTAIAMAKIRINEAAGIVAPIAHQLHGAIGFTHEHVLHQSTRRVLAWRDDWGTETEWSEKLAEQLMQLEDNGLWPFLTV
ncbi:acyl-CoA dehydrogenase family protein [Brevibacillus choshinensis]|uniref:acyl-CoA dehydrogenase family protein n=1 Tax=Brevibacillus choshinensis TaxID=54911 RepID=UPI002E1B7ED7|nr:acyl-CoA/acyl-ACP dehydrogenase [Brevibacillus choshinensis]